MDRAITELRAAIRFGSGRFARRAKRIPGSTLALYREASGVDQVRVAERLGVTKQRVNNIERDGCPREYAERFRLAVEEIASEAE